MADFTQSNRPGEEEEEEEEELDDSVCHPSHPPCAALANDPAELQDDQGCRPLRNRRQRDHAGATAALKGQKS